MKTFNSWKTALEQNVPELKIQLLIQRDFITISGMYRKEVLVNRFIKSQVYIDDPVIELEVIKKCILLEDIPRIRKKLRG